jgi:hypothetical protein
MEFLITTQILFSNLTNKKNPSKTIGYKLICPKWHFHQVGHGAKRTKKMVFLLIFLVEKVTFSCSD